MKKRILLLFLIVVGMFGFACEGRAAIVDGTPSGVEISVTGDITNGSETWTYTGVNFNGYSSLWFYLSEPSIAGDFNPTSEPLTKNDDDPWWQGDIEVGTVSATVTLTATVSGAATIVGTPENIPADWRTTTSNDLFVQAQATDNAFSVKIEAKVGEQTLAEWYNSIAETAAPDGLVTTVSLGTLYDTSKAVAKGNGDKTTGDEKTGNKSVVPDPVPEPATLAIWGMLSGVGLVVARRRRKPMA